VENIIKQAENFVRQLFETKLSTVNFYHNIEHTQRVVERITQLAEWEGCSDGEKNALQLVAWFHDTGFVEKDEGHEEVSARIAADFLKSNQVSNDEIELIKSLILVSRKESIPNSKLEMITKDADCSHVASDYYFEVSDLLRQEIALKRNTTFTDLEWLEGNKSFFVMQQFYTDSAKLKWQPFKDLNERELDAKIDKIKSNLIPEKEEEA